MLHAKDYEKLQHPENFSLSAMVKLSQMRRRLAKNGYEFLNIGKSGETILLIEAARATECLQTKLLARHFLKLVNMYDDDLRPQKINPEKPYIARNTQTSEAEAA